MAKYFCSSLKLLLTKHFGLISISLSLEHLWEASQYCCLCNTEVARLRTWCLALGRWLSPKLRVRAWEHKRLNFFLFVYGLGCQTFANFKKTKNKTKQKLFQFISQWRGFSGTTPLLGPSDMEALSQWHRNALLFCLLPEINSQRPGTITFQPWPPWGGPLLMPVPCKVF